MRSLLILREIYGLGALCFGLGILIAHYDKIIHNNNLLPFGITLFITGGILYFWPTPKNKQRSE